MRDKTILCLTTLRCKQKLTENSPEGTSTGTAYIEFRYKAIRESQKRYICYVEKHQRELLNGLIRIHVLIHASHEAIFGLAMMEELRHHGYRIGPGTLYPLLHGMERAGLLKSALTFVESRKRRVYKITAAGRKTLLVAKVKVDELHHELHEEHPRSRSILDKSAIRVKAQS